MTVLQEPVQVPTPGRHGLGLGAAFRPQGPARPGLAGGAGPAASPAPWGRPPRHRALSSGEGASFAWAAPGGAASPGRPLRRWERARARPAGRSGRSLPPARAPPPSRLGARGAAGLPRSFVRPLPTPGASGTSCPRFFCPFRAPAGGSRPPHRRRCRSPAEPQLSRLSEKALSVLPCRSPGRLVDNPSLHLTCLSAFAAISFVKAHSVLSSVRVMQMKDVPSSQGVNTFRLMGVLGGKMM